MAYTKKSYPIGPLTTGADDKVTQGSIGKRVTDAILDADHKLPARARDQDATGGADVQISAIEDAIDAFKADIADIHDYLGGLGTSNGTDADHDIDIAVGACMDSGNAEAMRNSAVIVKQADANWAAGTAVGGMPATVIKTGTFTTVGTAVTGSGTAFNTEFSVDDILHSDDKGAFRRITAIASAIAMTIETAFPTDVTVADTVKKNGLAPRASYHVHALWNPTTLTFGAGFDTRPDAVNLLADAAVAAAGFTKYRRIGSVLTDANSNIVAFSQRGDEFLLSIPLAEFVDPNPGTSRVTKALSVPLGVPVTAIFSGALVDASNTANTSLLFTSPDQADTAPSSSLFDLRIGPGADRDGGEFRRRTNTSRQIHYRLSASTADHTVLVTLHGWVDQRGKAV